MRFYFIIDCIRIDSRLFGKRDNSDAMKEPALEELSREDDAKEEGQMQVDQEKPR